MSAARTSGRLRYVRAGHDIPLLIETGGGERELAEGILFLGMLPDCPVEVAEEKLAPGELLCIYTDGLTEAEGAGQEQYGTERLKALLKTQRGEDAESIGRALLDSVADFSGGAPRGDDMTLIVLRRN